MRLRTGITIFQSNRLMKVKTARSCVRSSLEKAQENESRGNGYVLHIAVFSVSLLEVNQAKRGKGKGWIALWFTCVEFPYCKQAGISSENTTAGTWLIMLQVSQRFFNLFFFSFFLRMKARKSKKLYYSARFRRWSPRIYSEMVYSRSNFSTQEAEEKKTGWKEHNADNVIELASFPFVYIMWNDTSVTFAINIFENSLRRVCGKYMHTCTNSARVFGNK